MCKNNEEIRKKKKLNNLYGREKDEKWNIKY